MSTPWRWRRPSYVAKKNVRPRRIGPPSDAAELVALERMRIRRRELEEVARVERVVAEELEGLAAEPSVPERVTRLTTAPDTWPCSALNAELSTLNSWMLPSGGSKTERAERQVVGA